MIGSDRTPCVAVVGTFDTKGEEFAYLAGVISAEGVRPVLIDCGVLGAAAIDVDVPAAEVARAGGRTLEELQNRRVRADAVGAMGRGAAEMLRPAVAAGRIHGLIGGGGSNGATIASLASEALPFGYPKVIVSTIAAGDTRPFVNAADVMLMYPLVDIEGLNGVTRSVFDRAGAAVAAMARAAFADTSTRSVGNRSIVAATMFGVTTPCVNAARRHLEQAGDEVLVFHATGVGGQSYERLVESGRVAACLDVTTTELADELVGGALSAGPDRLLAAGRAGVPQVVSTGAVDMVNFGRLETVPDSFRDRLLYAHNENVTLMRTNAAEATAIGQAIGARVMVAGGPCAVVLPLGGVSSLDVPGGPFADVEANDCLFDAIRRTVKFPVRLVESEHHINEAEFAQLLVTTLAKLRTVSPAKGGATRR